MYCHNKLRQPFRWFDYSYVLVIDHMVVCGMFQLQGKPWLNLFRSCHKITRFETLYSVHLVHGESIEGKAVTPSRPSFNRGSSLLYKGVNPESLYSQVSGRVSQHQQLKYSLYVDTKFMGLL